MEKTEKLRLKSMKSEIEEKSPINKLDKRT